VLLGKESINKLYRKTQLNVMKLFVTGVISGLLKETGFHLSQN